MKQASNKRHGLELSSIFRHYGTAWLSDSTLCIEQRNAYQGIVNCRTAAMGGHLDRCGNCQYETISYNSCRNRHCPKCQYNRQVEWVEKLKGKLPATRYFHLVFTIPSSLHRVFYINQRESYKLLFKASAQALKQVAENPKFLGGQTGAVALLHTWGQALTYHPHIHMIVPAGGLSADQAEWISAGKKFFLPVRALSKVYRALLCKYLARSIGQGLIKLPSEGDNFTSLKKKLYQKDWNVYLKRARGGAQSVIRYLGQYTHRVAISNSRLVSFDKGKVTFRWRDYRKGNSSKVLSLQTEEFIGRFLRHVLPRGFYKVRYYGLLSPANNNKLAMVRFLLGFTYPNAMGGHTVGALGCGPAPATGKMLPYLCPQCKRGKMVLLKMIMSKGLPPPGQ